MNYGRSSTEEHNSFLDNLSDLENMVTDDALLSPMDFLFLSQVNDNLNKPKRSRSSSNLVGSSPKPRANRKSNSSLNFVAAGKPKAIKTKSKIKLESNVSVVSDEPDPGPKLKRSYSTASLKRSSNTSTEGLKKSSSTGTFLGAKKVRSCSNIIDAEGGLNGDHENSYVDPNSLNESENLVKCSAVIAKERRRERNKVLARKTRVKKKREMETLRDQVCQLQKENERLKNIVKTKLPPVTSSQVLVSCNSQLPDNVLSAVQVLLSRLESIEMNFGTKLQQHQKAFIISNGVASDNQIVYASKGFLELTGYEMHQVLGKNCRFLQGPETDMEEVAYIKQAIHDSQEVRTIIRNYKHNGTPFWNLLQISPLRDIHGNVSLIIATLVEVSLPSKNLLATLRTRVNDNNNDKETYDVSNLFKEGFENNETSHVSSASDSVSVTSSDNNGNSDESVTE